MFAGTPYSLPVTRMAIGEKYFAAVEMQLFKVRYLGADGNFDGYAIHLFEWLSGPLKGTIGRSYAQSFWKRPTHRERLQMWHAMTPYEQQKLLAGGYQGLNCAWFGQTA